MPNKTYPQPSIPNFSRYVEQIRVIHSRWHNFHVFGLFWRLLGWNSKGLNWKTKKPRVPSFLDWGDKGTASRVTWMFKGGYRLGIPQQILLVRRPAESKRYPWAPANTTGRGTFLFSPCGGEIWVQFAHGWFTPIHTYPGLGGGNSNIFYFHPEPWGRCPILTSIFFRWVGSTTN